MTWAPCDTGLTSFTPSDVNLTPDPPVIGSPATFTIIGTIGTEVTGGTVDMTVSFSGLPIYSQQFDLCTKTKCPVAPGPITLTLVEALPPIAPPGDYGLQIIARSPDGGELTCVNVDFSLVLPSAGQRSQAAGAADVGASEGQGEAAGGAGDAVATQGREVLHLQARAAGTARRMLV
ncbi:hypothetical protein GPECTOR_18g25 [Gonium pectorale]|uniref:MD-2-related lipid-recognition domain-containing protein n=1 Tax=Gonium pectorale TaxID=33097 RepID=A0A150GJV6_GONPE|nr:hypothetical protein GPECTOR_18g25 [Gonium pectorale]|eukprot:KXZ50044.1 hypothetical protein GPECTOR_18g25 [Gonium pectorale]